MRLCWLVVLLSLLTSTVFAAGEGRTVAITIDDLPRGGDGGPYDLAGVRAMTKKLLRPFREQQIPVIGFANTGRTQLDPQGLQEILNLWLDAGAELGNHSYSHPDINSVPLDVYTADIVRGEAAIRQALAPRAKTLEFYRHPYLHTGPTPEIKKGLQEFLDQRGYRVAPVTLDNSEYAFAVAYLQPELRERVRREYVPYMESIVEFFERRSVEIFGREIPQILLIHANELNADLMPELLGMFRSRGYKFVTLSAALADPAYQSPDEYAGSKGFSWIHRWSSTKGMIPKSEPDPAEWVTKAFAAGREAGAQPPNAIGQQTQSATLTFSDLTGWWSADPVHAGESSRVVLQFSEKEGKPMAALSLPAIGVHGVSLGTVTLAENRIDTKPLSFPLTWNPDRRTLSGVLPRDAVPIYDIPVEFRRSEPIAKPEPMQWQGRQPKVKWSVQVGAPAWAGLERDAQSGLLFVGNEQGLLNAVDASGAIRWKFPTGKPIRGRPAVIGESVYVTADSGFLYRLDKRTGVEKWRARIDSGSPERIPTDQEKSRWDRYGSSVVADSKHIYVASRDKNLYALDPENGREIWHVTAGDMMTATPAVYRDLVLFAAFDGKVQAVSARDGKLRWTYDAKLAVPGDLVVSGDRVLLGSRTYDLIALDAATGKEQWRRYYWFSWIESPPVVRDGVVYTGSSDAVSVYAINAADGSLRWKTPVPGWSWSRTAVNDRLVVAGTVGVGPVPGSRNGALVALERSSGAVRWLYQQEPSKDVIDAKKSWGFGASPLIVDDIVYAVDLDGRLYAFELGS